MEVLKDKDVVVVYEVPAAHQSAQTRRRMSFPFDKASSPVVGVKSDLPFFVIHRYHKYGPLPAPSACACVMCRVCVCGTHLTCVRALFFITGSARRMTWERTSSASPSPCPPT